MPRAVDLEEHNIPGSHYGYSATRPEELTATEYTLVTLVLDESGSTDSFQTELEKCIKAIVASCQYSPRADNLLLRLTAFGDKVREIHGYKPLAACNQADYDGCYGSGGMTALYDATENAVKATSAYARKLSEQDYDVNAIVFVLTDGADNRSSYNGLTNAKKALADCVKDENMESLVSVLIGVNVNDSLIAQYLAKFEKDAGFNKYEKIENANPKSIAKIAEFVSKSISSQSQALGSGSMSKAISSLTI